MVGKMYRQGDVLLREVDSIPADLKRMAGTIVLATGEHSGHNHRFEEGTGVCGFYKEGAEDHLIAGGTTLVGGATSVAYIEVPSEGADLVHEEHDPIKVEGGDYEVIRQREYVAPGIERLAVD